MGFDVQSGIRKAAKRYGVDAKLLSALVGAESAGNQGAVSPKGAQGLGQLMPATARALGVNPNDPQDNLMGSAKYLRQQLDAFGGSVPKALAAYNAGPGAVTKYGGIPPYAETQAYVKKIMAAYGSGTGAVGGSPAGGPSRPAGAGSGAVAPSTRTTRDSETTPGSFVPGVDNSGARAMATLEFLRQDRSPLDFVAQIAGLADVEDQYTPPSTTVTYDETPTAGKTGAPKAGGKLLVVGDSLGVGTAPYLKGATADVKVGRTSAQGAKALQQRLKGGSFSQIVLDLGTNDGDAVSMAESIKQALRAAPDADIYLPSVNGPGAARKNAALKQLAGGRVHFVPLDVETAQDGIHLTAKGYQQRAGQLQAALGRSTNVASSLTGGLVRSIRTVDQLFAKHGVPVTAKQEPGHASGGDHDPAVKGATARDGGGSEAARKAAFTDLMRALGVQGAEYGGADVNVTRDGLRWQVISRPHGTGPHLHVGVRGS